MGLLAIFVALKHNSPSNPWAELGEVGAGELQTITKRVLNQGAPRAVLVDNVPGPRAAVFVVFRSRGRLGCTWAGLPLFSFFGFIQQRAELFD